MWIFFFFLSSDFKIRILRVKSELSEKRQNSEKKILRKKSEFWEKTQNSEEKNVRKKSEFWLYSQNSKNVQSSDFNVRMNSDF